MKFDEWTSLFSLITFILLGSAEAWISIRRHNPVYERTDTLTNVALGLLTFCTKVGSRTAVLWLYSQIFELSFWKLPENSWIWFIAGLLLNDLLFYWYHRLCHTTRFFWAVHVAHHSSERMNITTAVRGNFLNNIFHSIFWIPMLLLGFPPIVVITTDAFAYFYQLWLHTTIIPKLGPVEWLLNTPSHHRVHHGSNPKYLDKNYGAVFIFWDRIFGTFEEETEHVRYGLTKPFKSSNPLWVAFHEFDAVFKDMRKKTTAREKIRELFRKP